MQFSQQVFSTHLKPENLSSRPFAVAVCVFPALKVRPVFMSLLSLRRALFLPSSPGALSLYSPLLRVSKQPESAGLPFTKVLSM